MQGTTVRFLNDRGEALAAKVDVPADGPPRAWALFAHCFTCTKNLLAVRRIARSLADEGIAVLSFDFAGLGESEGSFSETTFSSQAADLVAAAAFMKAEYGSSPAIMIGHSLGGTATLFAARKIDGVEGIATIGAPADPVHVTKLFTCEVEEIERTGEARVSIGGRPFSIRKEFIDDLRAHPPSTWLGELRTRVLIFHSPIDNVVDISNAQDIYTAVRHPKSFVSLDRADHLLSNARDARHVARVLAAWADSFLPAPAPSSDGFVEPAEGWNVTGRIGRDHYRVTLSDGRHHQLADEPSDAGGGDLGGTPFDYLLWGLAACTVMTVRMYADRKEWPLEEVTTHLKYSRHAAEELGFPAEWARETRGQGTHIRVSLALRGALDDDQRARLVEIAHRCPVHRTLVGPIKVSIESA